MKTTKRKRALAGKESLSRSVSMVQIAQVAGVSLGTVSNVVNGNIAVSEQLKQRVLETIRSLGYQPSQMARGLRKSATNMIGMIIPDITNPFFPAVVRGAEDIAYAHSYRLLLGNSDNDSAKESDYFNELRTYRPAGVVAIPSLGTGLVTQLRSNDPPLVLGDRCPPGWAGDIVVSGNEEGAAQATAYLLQEGHRRLATITGPLEFSNARERREGFLRMVRKAELMLPMEYLQEGRFTRASGYECMARLLKLKSPPTAVFVANDVMAIGAIEAIRAAGLSCPEDVSILGFDDLEYSGFVSPPLTTVNQSGYELGVATIRLLLERIKNPNRPAETVVLKTELVIRGSVARIRGKKGLRTA